jgi:hypothetical protein
MIKKKIPCHVNKFFFIMVFSSSCKKRKKRVEYSKVHEAMAHTVSNIRMSKVFPSLVAAPNPVPQAKRKHLEEAAAPSLPPLEKALSPKEKLPSSSISTQ